MKKKAICIAGLGLGDEGKGSIVDFLTRTFNAQTVVRYNGGSQAAHHVVTGDGIMHCFSQFGAGSLVPGVKSYLDKRMLVDPLRLKTEAKVLASKTLGNPYEYLYIHGQCLVVTAYHGIMNQIREIARGAKRHGSCGLGVGETIIDAQEQPFIALRIDDFGSEELIRSKLSFIRDIKIADTLKLIRQTDLSNELTQQLEQLMDENYFNVLVENYYSFLSTTGITVVDDISAAQLLACETSIFEGAQGVLLDRQRGFVPHITKTNTTFNNADEILREYAEDSDSIKLGVLRAYGTRHGAGPFVSEEASLRTVIPELHNITNEWQSEFRLGWFDLVMTRYSLELIGTIDGIALTHLDRLQNLKEIKICCSYEYTGTRKEELSAYFDIVDDGNKIFIERIKVPAKIDLIHQQNLTELLYECKPVYENINDDSFSSEKYVDILESLLKTPITLVSYGPTSDDKKFREPLCH